MKLTYCEFSLLSTLELDKPCIVDPFDFAASLVLHERGLALLSTENIKERTTLTLTLIGHAYLAVHLVKPVSSL